MTKINQSSNLPQREKAKIAPKGQRARSDGLLRPLLALFYDSNLSSLKDYARTVDASEYFRNKKCWKKKKWSTLRNLSPKTKQEVIENVHVRTPTFEHQRRGQSNTGLEYAEWHWRFENYVQMMISSTGDSRSGIFQMIYDYRAMCKKFRGE